MLRTVCTLLLLMGFTTCSAQLYLEKQTRHRFAQMHIGVDYTVTLGGLSSYIGMDGNIQNLDFPILSSPRITIGGTHFWGHADFLIAIPLGGSSFEESNQSVNYTSGVETIFKAYPWRIKKGYVRPYIGTSISPFYFEQDNNNMTFGNGPEVTSTNFPIHAGLTFQTGSHFLELGLSYNYDNHIGYHLSREVIGTIETPALSFALSYRYTFDTTIGAEPDWESGRTAEVTKSLEERGKLNGFFMGIGMSSALWLGRSDYNTSDRPYVSNYGWSLMPDFCAGYYMHDLDLSISINYRSYGGGATTYGARQTAHRSAVGLEAIKFLGDFHGFVPFIGPVLSYDKLSFKESYEGDVTHDVSQRKLTVGVTFGWDIRPNRLQGFILRTNLRYFPSIDLGLEGGETINFNNLEFNFIQAIIYPGRMF